MGCEGCGGTGGEGYPAVRVHLAAVEPGAAAALSTSSPAPAASPRRPRRSTVRTFVCTSATPIAPLCGQDDRRLYADVRALDQDVVICTDLSQAQDTANTTASQPNPNGYVVQSANPVPERIEHAGPLWAVAASYPARVSVKFVHEEGP